MEVKKVLHNQNQVILAGKDHMEYSTLIHFHFAAENRKTQPTYVLPKTTV